MNFIKVHRTFPRLKKVLLRRSSQAVALDDNEYTETPEYPPILDVSKEGVKLRKREAKNEKLKNLKTVEEKQIALNLPRYYGWGSVMLTEDKVPYNALPMVKSYTRTHFVAQDKLPDLYAEVAPAADGVVAEIKSLVEDAIAIEHEGLQRKFTPNDTIKTVEHQNEDALAKNIARQVNRIISNNLSDKVPHILPAQVDYDPRHEAFWFVGGVHLSRRVIRKRAEFPWQRDKLLEPKNRTVQYLGKPLLALRGHLPLKPLMPYSEATNPEFQVPKFTYVPQNVGYVMSLRHATNIPGYWPGDYDEFGFLSIHGRGHLLSRKQSFGPEDNIEALHCQAIKASFGWLAAQANYQGFTTFNDLTYPLATQTVITNGQIWSLYAYQLNTILMHSEHIDTNPKHNICFGTQPMKLFDTIEDGKVKGLNENVLKMLVQFYMNTPEERDYDMKPYLDKEESVIADIEDDNRRCWLEETYKHLVSNRPKHLLPPETYLWERIYKIQHNTRFFEKKRRPFELGINPYKRRLSDHLPPYIPKVLRPYPKCRKKFETTYYPKI
ncbi:large ribosomal subunit protein mL65 [Cydia amplana]|uniref:large ribosomal subunit protein mL65 n=1 Tax=Cydia amplana TaxID=1869771 RepID=UPI002FE55339